MDLYRVQLDNHISKIDNLVNNFEKIHFVRRALIRNTYIPTQSYTNFSVAEILKPDFRSHVTCAFDSDSDGTHSADSSELYSSGDEEYQYGVNESRLSESPDYIHKFEALDPRLLPPRISNLRHVARDDDSISSDGSDNEAALDLRIERKKTPPKMMDKLPAWVFCTRYSDRPSAGPRAKRPRQKSAILNRRNRTAFTAAQLHQLNLEFDLDPYLSESRRLRLADDLDLHESSIKIWFQNQRAKTKKDRLPHPLAARLAKDGLYNHKSVN